MEKLSRQRDLGVLARSMMAHDEGKINGTSDYFLLIREELGSFSTKRYEMRRTLLKL